MVDRKKKDEEEPDSLARAGQAYQDWARGVGEWAGPGGEEKDEKPKKKPPKRDIYEEPSPYGLPSRRREPPGPRPSAATTRGIEELQTPPAAPDAIAPSREVLQEIAEQTLQGQKQKEIEREGTRAGARAVSTVYNQGADPPGQGSNQPTTAPSDKPLPKGGTGPGADTKRPPGTGEDSPKDPGYYDQVKMVRTKDGKIVAVDMPAGQRIVRAGGEWMDYSTAVEEAGTRVGETGPEQGGDANVVSGRSGTAYFTGDDPGDLAAAIPQERDTSPGWASRAALNEAYRKGELSMDARDVMDRRRWEKAEEARDMERDLVRAQADAAIATEEYKLREAQLDPLERARIAAEAKWGPQLVKEEGLKGRIEGAIGIYQEIMAKIKEARDTMPAGPSLDSYIEMLERFARDQANIIMGHAVRDPRTDPLTAFLSTLGTPKTEPTEK